MSADKAYGMRGKDNNRRRNKNSTDDEIEDYDLNDQQFEMVLRLAVDYEHNLDEKAMDLKVRKLYDHAKQKADKDIQSTRKSLQSEYPLADSPTPPESPSTPTIQSRLSQNITVNEPKHPNVISYRRGNQEQNAIEYSDSDADDESSNSSRTKHQLRQKILHQDKTLFVQGLPYYFTLSPNSDEKVIDPPTASQITIITSDFQKTLCTKGEQSAKMHERPQGNENDLELKPESMPIEEIDPVIESLRVENEFEISEMTEEHRDFGSKILVMSGSDEGNPSESEGEEVLNRSEVKCHQTELVDENLAKRLRCDCKVKEDEVKTVTYRNRLGKMVQREVQPKRSGKKHEYTKDNPINKKEIDEILAFLEEPVVEKKMNTKIKEKKRKSKETKEDSNPLIQSENQMESIKSPEREKNTNLSAVSNKNKKTDNPPNPSETARNRTLPTENSQPIESSNQPNEELFIMVSKTKKAQKSQETRKGMVTKKSFDQAMKSFQKINPKMREKRNSSDSLKMNPRGSLSKCSPPSLDSFPRLNMAGKLDSSRSESCCKKSERTESKNRRSGHKSSQRTPTNGNNAIERPEDEISKSEINPEYSGSNNSRRQDEQMTEKSEEEAREPVVMLVESPINVQIDDITFFFNSQIPNEEKSETKRLKTRIGESMIVKRSATLPLIFPSDALSENSIYKKIVDSWREFQADSKPYVYSSNGEPS